MHEDIERWNRKYSSSDPLVTGPPDPILIQHRHLLDGDGIALDVACGLGQNTRFLADLGYRVVAVDVSSEALRRVRNSLDGRRFRVDLIVADLDRFTLPPNCFDAIVVVKYLNRALVPSLLAGLKSGGLLFYRTFNQNFLTEHKSFNPAYVLAPGETAALFEGLEALATNDCEDPTSALTYWIGRKD